MNRQEAIRIVKDLSDCSHIGSLAGEDIEALKMAIKALAQEPMLDKIRAEIEEYRDGMPWESKSLVKWEAINYILEQIIDKYKAESEPQESEE